MHFSRCHALLRLREFDHHCTIVRSSRGWLMYLGQCVIIIVIVKQTTENKADQVCCLGLVPCFSSVCELGLEWVLWFLSPSFFAGKNVIEVVHLNFSQKRKQGESDLISSHQISSGFSVNQPALDFSTFSFISMSEPSIRKMKSVQVHFQSSVDYATAYHTKKGGFEGIETQGEWEDSEERRVRGV